MRNLYAPPVALVRRENSTVPVLLGLSNGELAGFDPIHSLPLRLDLSNIVGFVSTDPAAVCFGADALFTADAETLRWAMNPVKFPRFLTNPRKDSLKRYYSKPLGERFEPMPLGVISGYSLPEPTILRLRKEVPTAESLTLSMIFAGFSVRTGIETTEAGYECFGRKFLATRMFPRWKDLKDCARILGLPNMRRPLYEESIPYGHVIHDYMRSGLRDRELRRVLARETKLPRGLSLAKLSFALALCGQDLVCLDARLLNRMFGSKVDEVEGLLGAKLRSGFVSDFALARYERIEDAFLRGNRYYDSAHPIGRARAQWMSWESAPFRGSVTGATHEVWLKLIR